jgi:DNA-binding transcriptional regulator/RsmH inhibitor MraZ
VIIEDRLLKHAKINKNVVFVGVGKQIRVWAEELWIEREEKRDFAKMREILAEYGL